MLLRPPFVLAITGSSLSAGKLAGVPNLWHAQLEHDLRLQPEAVGKIVILRMGHGGWTSQDVLNEAPTLSAQRPTHIIADIDINDCFVSGGIPVYDRPTKIAHQLAMIAAWKTNNPGVDITFQTMSSVSTAVGAARPNLASYYADTIATAAAQGSSSIGSLDNFSGWPNPLPEALTHQFDGLHPVWAGAVERYAYRNILFLMRQKMAAFWGLSAPVAPIYPTAPDVQFLLIAGGGGGGDAIGGGGGAGDVIRGVDYGPNLVGAITVGAAGVAASGQPGTTGGDTTAGAYRAKGGGGGGLYANNTSTSTGKDGASGGGGAPFVASHAGGNSTGQGFPGTSSSAVGNGGAGAGGGCAGPATAGSGVDGGTGGLGWQDDVPGDSQDVGGGGPGGSLSGTRAAYGLGGGPTKFGGGGQGGGNGSGTGAGDNGGPGVAYFWYPGAPRYTGGVITSSGGFTVHKFTTSGTLS